MAALAAYGVDDFNDISASNGTDSPLARNAGSFEYTASVEGYDYDISEPVVFWGTDRTGGNVALSTSFHDDTVTFSSFTGGVAAFGGYFFVTDINGTPRAGDIVLTVTDADGTFMDPITGATEGTFVSVRPGTSLTASGGHRWVVTTTTPSSVIVVTKLVTLR